MLSPDHRRRPALPVRLVGAVLGLLVVVTGCSGDGDEGRSASSPPSSPTRSEPTKQARPPLRTTTKVGEVVGKLSRERRRRAAQQVSRVVDRWWEAAYLGDDFQRQQIRRKSFPGFTPVAYAQARGDKSLTTNAALGPKVDATTATRRRVTVDLLATDGRARTATARIGLNFRTVGEKREVVAIRGRLMLTREKDGWRIFGYDLSRGEPEGRTDQKDRRDRKDRKDQKNARDRKNAEDRRDREGNR